MKLWKWLTGNMDQPTPIAKDGYLTWLRLVGIGEKGIRAALAREDIKQNSPELYAAYEERLKEIEAKKPVQALTDNDVRMEAYNAKYTELCNEATRYLDAKHQYDTLKERLTLTPKEDGELNALERYTKEKMDEMYKDCIPEGTHVEVVSNHGRVIAVHINGYDRLEYVVQNGTSTYLVAHNKLRRA